MKIREQMPDLKGATTWLNERVDRYDLIGQKPTLIHFWSASCRQCKEAIRDVNYIRDRYKGQLNVVAVHMPRNADDNDLDTIKALVRLHDITQPVFVDNALILSDAFDNQFVPAYYVFDKHGQLRHFQAGGSGSMHTLENRVSRVVDEIRM